MLEKPDLQEEKIIACLQTEYGLSVEQVVFLPLGADRNSATYRIVSDEDVPYFLKLRRGNFNEISVAFPKFLHDQGIRLIIPPLVTQSGKLTTNLDAFRAILYPFVEGKNVYETRFTERQWVKFGATLKSIHTASVPPALTSLLQRETYSAYWRETVKTFLKGVDADKYDEPVAVETATLLKAKRVEILDLVQRAGRLAQMMQTESPEFIACHSDLHAGNLLIAPNDDLYIVDWDDPILAPKERDLMYIGGGLMGAGYSPQEEEALFYEGYGQTTINPIALAYYRYERIVQDIAAYCGEILLTNEGGDDREQSLRYLKSNFLPHHVIQIAYQSDRTGING
jgi:spectinomycin phosphotransferase